MARRRSSLLFSICSTFLVVLVALPAYGWWPIAHYEITKNAGFPQFAPYSQLPDYEDSWKAITTPGWSEVYEMFDISLMFCWGHSVQDAGETAGRLAPIKPTYPDDGRYPEVDMLTLIGKMKNLTAAQKTEMENTARGFMSHNAADRDVHFGYFGGANAGDGPLTAAIAWGVHHRVKEKWADYWTIIRNYFDGDVSAAFDANGRLRLPADYAKGIPVASPTDDMAKIMQLAQKVSRKNRRFTEAGVDYHIITPQSLEEIKTQVKGKTVDPYSNANMATLYTRDDFNRHNLAAVLHGWTLSGLDAKYQQAINNVKAWQQANPAN